MKYVNPGYTFISFNSAIQKFDYTKNLNNGACMLINNTPVTLSVDSSTKYWVKFGLYLSKTTIPETTVLKIYSQDHYISFKLVLSENISTLTGYIDGSISIGSINIIPTVYSDIFISVSFESSTASISLQNITKQEKINYSNSISFESMNITSIDFLSPLDSGYFSNIIISNIEFPYNEGVILFKMNDSLVDWYYDNTEYKTNKSNSRLLLKADTMDAINKIGCSFPKINDLFIACNNMHSDVDSFKNIYFAIENNGSINNALSKSLTTSSQSIIVESDNDPINKINWRMGNINKSSFGVITE